MTKIIFWIFLLNGQSCPGLSIPHYLNWFHTYAIHEIWNMQSFCQFRLAFLSVSEMLYLCLWSVVKIFSDNWQCLCLTTIRTILNLATWMKYLGSVFLDLLKTVVDNKFAHFTKMVFKLFSFQVFSCLNVFCNEI